MNSINFFGMATDGSIIFTSKNESFKLMVGPTTGKPMVRPVDMECSDEAFDAACAMSRVVNKLPNILMAYEVLVAMSKDTDVLAAALEA